METYNIALFGEAEKGEYRTAHYCQSIPQLLDYFGHPPPESRGIFYAIQALLYNRGLIFFRVKEEGFSYEDYLLGLRLLQKQEMVSTLAAIYLPGVGDSEIIRAIKPICTLYHSILITNEGDFYDYLTEIAA